MSPEHDAMRRAQIDAWKQWILTHVQHHGGISRLDLDATTIGSCSPESLASALQAFDEMVTAGILRLHHGNQQ